MIEVHNLTKVFGSKIAVNKLNFKVKKGEIFGFLGPNAAGKTTTIKLLTGLLMPTEGEAYICGFNIQKDFIAAKSVISYIPDVPYLYERLTGREFLRFVADIYKVKDYSRKIEDLLSLFTLEEFSDMLIEEYSHGMRQKLVICAALLHEPKVIIIDEPMVGLDPKAARIAKDIFKDSARKGISIFMSTHTLSMAEEICDRIGIIDEGNLIAVGTMDELRNISGIQGRLEEIFLKLT